MGICFSSNPSEPDPGPNALEVEVVLTSGKKVKMKIAPEETFGKVKARVVQKDPGMELSSIRLARNFQGMALNLDDEGTVGSVGLKAGDQLICQKVDESVPQLNAVVASNEESLRALGDEHSIKKVF